MRPEGVRTPRRAAPLVLAAAAAACAACAPSAAPAPAGKTGADLYSGNCVACHQQNGQGIPNVYPSLVGSAVVLGDPAAFARWVVKGQRPASLPAGRYSTVMPQFGWMKDSDVAALLTYVRGSFGNSAPAVDPAALTRALRD